MKPDPTSTADIRAMAELKARTEEEYDPPLTAWRVARAQSRIAHPELLPPALHAAAEMLAHSFEWDDTRARAALPSQEIDPVSATRGGPAGMLQQLEAELLAAGEHAELDQTRFNMDVARLRLGQLNALALQDTSSE